MGNKFIKIQNFIGDIMMRKSSFMVCIFFLFPAILIAGSFQQDRDSTIALIKSGQFDSVKIAIDKFIADFPQDALLPETLCWFAEEYGYAGKRDEEKKLDSLIVQKWPDISIANKAKLCLASSKIRDLIVSSDFEQAKDAVDKMIIDFNNSPDLSKVLYRLARGFEWQDKYQQAKEIFEQIVRRNSETNLTEKSRLGICRMDICLLIVLNKMEEAQSQINQLNIDFSNHSDLFDTYFWIGRAYEKSKKYEQAKSVFQQVMTNWPQCSYIGEAEFGFLRMDVSTIIASKNLEQVKLALNKLISNYSDNLYLPEATSEIIGQCYKAYYDTGQTLIDGSQPDNNILRLVTEDIEYSVNNNSSMGKVNKAYMYYLIGQSYRMLGEYPKAVQHLVLTIDTDPNFEKAPHCLFAAGQCYEKMTQSGSMPENQAIESAKKFYQQALGRNLDSAEEKYITKWLEKHENQ